MEKVKLTDKHLQILQHSLGVDKYGLGAQYRNHFCPGARDVTLCQQLKACGFMTARTQFGAAVYHVTRAGKAYMSSTSPKAPRLSRSKKRYLAWMDEADLHDFGFGEWIKRGLYKEGLDDGR